MVYDENIENDQERLLFRKELDRYLTQRRQKTKKEKRKDSKEIENNDSKKVNLEIYDEVEEDNKPVSFITWLKSLFLRRKNDVVSEELVEEEIIDEEPVESEEFNEEFEELEEERISSGFFPRLLALIKGIFVKEEDLEDEKSDEEYDKESKPRVTVEELENDLKTTFKLVKVILTNIPSRFVSRIKELKEFEEYREVINRYNQRHRKE